MGAKSLRARGKLTLLASAASNIRPFSKIQLDKCQLSHKKQVVWDTKTPESEHADLPLTFSSHMVRNPDLQTQQCVAVPSHDVNFDEAPCVCAAERRHYTSDSDQLNPVDCGWMKCVEVIFVCLHGYSAFADGQAWDGGLDLVTCQW